jgi:two-component system response regulator FixJ
VAARSKIRVDLIEDHEAVRESLALYLTSKGIETRTHESATAFLKLGLSDSTSDCIVTDVRMPGLTGLDLLKQLRKKGRTTQLILITAFGDVEIAVEAMKAGAFDFLLKPIDEQRLIASIRKAASRTEELKVKAEEIAEATARLNKLTDREREVMTLATQGFINRDIANKLGISQRTVEIHRASLMLKVGADSLPDLVRLSILAAGEN